MTSGDGGGFGSTQGREPTKDPSARPHFVNVRHLPCHVKLASSGPSDVRISVEDALGSQCGTPGYRLAAQSR